MGSRIVIEPIATEEMLRAGATVEDLAYVGQFGSVSRRCEVLAWRSIVRRELGTEVEISHDEYGAPTLNTPNIYISVSHSRDRVAVLFADRVCALDIESAERNFGRVVARYLSSEEQRLAEQHNLYAELWFAKEALYKYYKKGGLDFAKDISIKAYNADEGVLQGTILGGKSVEVKIKRDDNLVIAVID